MGKDKLTWLEELTKKKGVAETQEGDEKDNQQKQGFLSQLWNDVNLLADKQKDNFDITLESEKKGKEKKGLRGLLFPKKKQKVLDYEGRDQTEEFDLDEIQDGFGVASEEDLLKLSEAINTTEQLVQRMKSQTKKVKVIQKNDKNQDVEVEKEVPLFTDEEIAAEVYQPLVRRGILPETFVPDKYSKTRETIDVTFDAYKERNKAEAPKTFMDENGSLIFSTVSMVFTDVNVGLRGDMLHQGLRGKEVRGVKEGIEGGKNFKESWSTELNPTFTSETADENYSDHVNQIAADFELFNTANEWIATGWEAKEEIQEDVRDNQTQQQELQKEGAARLANLPRIAQGIVCNLAAQLSQAFEKGAGLSLAAASTFGALVTPQKLAASLKGTKTDKGHALDLKQVTKVVDNLGKAFEDTLKACAAKAGNAKASIEILGVQMNSTFTTSCQPAELLAALEEKKGKLDPSKAITLATNAGKAAMAAVKNDLENLLNEKANVTAMGEGLDAKMTEEIRAQNAKADKEEEEEKRQFEKALEGRDPKELMTIIEKKTAKLKRDESIIKWLCTIANMGIAQAAQAVAPLAILGSGIKILQNGRLAIKRKQDWDAFFDNQAHLFKAASEFSAPLENMIKNARLQFSHYTFIVATEGLNIVAAVLQCSGHGAAAGFALQTAVKGAQALEKWLVEVEKRYNLSQAWQLYKNALARPDNRKLALMAMKENPTLAKYAVAFGAVIRKDALVSDLLSYCGITEENVVDMEGKINEKEVNTKLDKVVEYLEARMPDDIKVVGRTVKLENWAPEPIELTLTCWTSAKKRGETKAKLLKGDTKDIEIALARFGGVFAEAKQNKANKQDPVVLDCKDVLDAMESAFKGYHPYMKEENSGREIDHGPMKHVVAEFLHKVAQARKEIV